MFVLSEDAYHPGIHWLEIHSAAGSKASAALALAAEIGASQIVAFGDNSNDLPLFEVADESYAVANAIASVRSKATGVIQGNDADAVAHWLLERHRNVVIPTSGTRR